jgi:hypothetical protein
LVIFVSHSCKDALLANPPDDVEEDRLARLRFAKRVRDRLVNELDPKGEGLVWFDRKRLDPGDPWELDIVSALHRCNAAVVLLTPDALESPWVLREATILADRRSRWPGLVLVPVLLAGSDFAALNANSWWRDLQFTRWQPVQAIFGVFEGPDAEADCEQVVREVTSRLAKLSTPSDPAMEGWADEVGSFLSEARRRQRGRRLSNAAKSLRMSPPDEWDDDAIQWLAQALLRADVVELDEAGRPTYPLIGAVGALVPGDARARPPTEDERDLCRWLNPVAAPPAASVGIAAARDAGQPSAPVVFGADAVRVAELAVRRATCGEAIVRPLSDVGGETSRLSPTDVARVASEAELAQMAGKPFYVVARLHPLLGDNIEAMATQMAADLPADVAMVLVVGRDVPVSAGGLVRLVEVTEEDEQAASKVDRWLAQYVEAH